MPERRTGAAAVPDAGDDTLREQVSRAVCAIAIGSERVETVMEIIQEHTAAAVQAEREGVRAICDAVEYKDPGWADTYTSYAEGRHDLAAEVLAALDETEARP